MSYCIALLRGVNIGRANRIAMAELRRLIEKLGYSDVRTLLNSGNAVFQASKPNTMRIASAIEDSIQRKFGFTVPVIVRTADELSAIVAENTLRQATRAPSRFLVAFLATPASLKQVKGLLRETWAPDAFAVGKRAAYLWCPGGIIESKLLQAFARMSKETATTRNWATVLKLQAAAGCASEHILPRVT